MFHVLSQTTQCGQHLCAPFTDGDTGLLSPTAREWSSSSTASAAPGGSTTCSRMPGAAEQKARELVRRGRPGTKSSDRGPLAAGRVTGVESAPSEGPHGHDEWTPLCPLGEGSTVFAARAGLRDGLPASPAQDCPQAALSSQKTAQGVPTWAGRAQGYGQAGATVVKSESLRPGALCLQSLLASNTLLNLFNRISCQEGEAKNRTCSGGWL